MALTIRRILGFAAVSDVHPQLLGQAQLLDSPVLGIHVTESADLLGLLEGGELILSSGLLLTTSVHETSAFLERLAAAGAVGVLFSFLSDAPEIKKTLALAAETSPIPVILLDDRARFVEITETVHGLIYSAAHGLSGVDAVSSFLSSASAAHLNVRDLFIGIADLLGEPLVFEDKESNVVLQRGVGTKNLRRFIQTREAGRTSDHGVRPVGEAKWLVYPVVSGGRQLGQLITPAGAGNLRAAKVIESVAQRLGMLLPNGPEDLALLRQNTLALLVSDARSVEPPSEKDLLVRAHMLGIETSRQFIPIVLNLKQTINTQALAPSTDIAAITSMLQRALLKLSHPAFACHLGAQELGIILCLPAASDPDKMMTQLHANVARAFADYGTKLHWTMGVGSSNLQLGEGARHGLNDARRVAHSASSMDHPSQSYHRAGDLGFRWLMQQLLDLEETRTYLHDQLAPFLEEPEYLDFIETYLQTNGSITEMSRALHLSRPSVYARLRRIEKVLGYELTDADTMTSLHLAVTLYRLGVHDPND